MFLLLDCVNCPVTIYELYTSKLHPDCKFLWQHPKQKVHYMDETWYEPRKVGHNPLETFMKELSKDAQLQKKYTNHSICSTCISKLDNSGFEAHHITALTSHKSESTIKECATKCPESKKKEMFQALADPITTPLKATNATATSGQGVITPKTPLIPTFNLQVPDQNAQYHILETWIYWK